MISFRNFLVLGRASNLPTVWSNCLAGWWLGGGGDGWVLAPLMIGATLLYLGGMFLNDAFDAGFDSLYRRERPIPAGKVPHHLVLKYGGWMLVAGLGCLAPLGVTTATLAAMLIIAIVVYDAVHKLVTFSPLLMALCRLLLYLVAASTATGGVTGWAIWGGLVLAAYIIGLSYLARKESLPGALRYWPCGFLAAPIILALFLNADSYLRDAALLSAVLGLWVLRALRHTFWGVDRNIGRTVSGLLAGIVLVDLLAVADLPHQYAIIFAALLGLALLFQRYVPAT